MMNAKFLTVSYNELQFNKGNMSSVKKSDGDFTKVLNEQQDNFKVASKSKEDSSLNETKGIEESSKRKEIANLYNKIKVDAKEEISPEEKLQIACEQVAQYIQNLIGKIKEELNVSVDEVVDEIKELNLNVTDLFDVKNISKLVMSLSEQNDMSMLLVDDRFSSLIKELGIEAEKMIDTLKQDLNLNDKEFEEFLQKFEETIKVNDFLVEDDSDIVMIDDVKVDSNNKNLEGKVRYESNEAQVSSVDTKAAVAEKDFGKSTSGDSGENNSALDYEGISMESVISKLQDKIENNPLMAKEGISKTVMNQILDGITANVNKEMTSLELQLNPESLGKVNVTVSAKEGILTAQIAAQTEIAKEAIESQIGILKETFENQGLKVEEVEVTLASKSFDQNLSNKSSDENGNSKSRRHISKEELDEINGIKTAEEEIVKEEVLKELGTTVSYQA